MAADPGEALQLSRAVRELSVGVDRYRRAFADELGLGVTEVLALGHLHSHGPITPRVLGTDLGLTAGSVTALVDRLVKAGFAARAPHRTDRRSVLINLTVAGRHAMAWLYEQSQACIADALGKVPDADILDVGRIVSLMTAIGAALGDGLPQRDAGPAGTGA
jgi:DNA-binding MarR family transcriptional regulator